MALGVGPFRVDHLPGKVEALAADAGKDDDGRIVVVLEGRLHAIGIFIDGSLVGRITLKLGSHVGRLEGTCRAGVPGIVEILDGLVDVESGIAEGLIESDGVLGIDLAASRSAIDKVDGVLSQDRDLASLGKRQGLAHVLEKDIAFFVDPVVDPIGVVVGILLVVDSLVGVIADILGLGTLRDDAIVAEDRDEGVLEEEDVGGKERDGKEDGSRRQGRNSPWPAFFQQVLCL